MSHSATPSPYVTRADIDVENELVRFEIRESVEWQALDIARVSAIETLKATDFDWQTTGLTAIEEAVLDFWYRGHYRESHIHGERCDHVEQAREDIRCAQPNYIPLPESTD